MNLLDLTKYKRPSFLPVASPTAKKILRRRTGDWFLKGPIPGWWLSAASELPGRTLHLALAIWHESKLAKGDRVVLHNRTLGRLNISRWAAYAGLRRLEVAGLIRVDRHSGRLPRILICNREEPRL